MNKVLENIKDRRSIKKFKPDMIPEEIINKILEAGIYAPSGLNKQSPIIIAVTNKAIRDRISELNAKVGGFKHDPFYGAPVIFIVLADKACNTYVYDGSLTLGNMMLAAHELGIGSCWIHRAKEEFEMPEGKEILKSLGIEGEFEGIGHCALGYMDCEYPKTPERKEKRLYFLK